MSSDYYQTCDDCKLIAHHHSGKYMTNREFLEDHTSMCKRGSVRVFFDYPELDGYEDFEDYIEHIAKEIGVDEKLLRASMYLNVDKNRKWWQVGFDSGKPHPLWEVVGYGATIKVASEAFIKAFREAGLE